MSRRTPGPWALRGHQIRGDAGRGQHVATYQTSIADGLLLAAAPELLGLLFEACEALDAAERSSGSHSTADRVRGRLATFGLIRLGLDEHGRESNRVEPADFDPDHVASTGGAP